MSRFDCNDSESRLQDFVDGLCDSVEERRMREHLAACESCCTEERELRRLLTRVAELPRSIEPPSDLWPGVAPRLAERTPDHAQEQRGRMSAGARAAGPGRRWTPRQWALQAAAAVAFMVLGAALSQFSAGPAPTGDGPPTYGDVRPAALSMGRFDALEAEYLRAKEDLWLMTYSRHDDLSPVKVETIRRNLLIIDEAISELREALAEDPGNRQLENRLLANHRRSIELLQTLGKGAYS